MITFSDYFDLIILTKLSAKPLLWREHPDTETLMAGFEIDSEVQQFIDSMIHGI